MEGLPKYDSKEKLSHFILPKCFLLRWILLPRDSKSACCSSSFPRLR